MSLHVPGLEFRKVAGQQNLAALQNSSHAKLLTAVMPDTVRVGLTKPSNTGALQSSTVVSEVIAFQCTVSQFIRLADRSAG